MEARRLLRKIRIWVIFMIIAIALSGITAFPVETELRLLLPYLDGLPEFIHHWLLRVYEGVADTNQRHPFIAYGFDWLAFAHLVIAMMFIGPLRDPVRNIWVIEWGMLACVSVVPLALIAGPVRDIPFFHQLIDCSFGLLGILPLIHLRRMIKKLEKLQAAPAGSRG